MPQPAPPMARSTAASAPAAANGEEQGLAALMRLIDRAAGLTPPVPAAAPPASRATPAAPMSSHGPTPGTPL